MSNRAKQKARRKVYEKMRNIKKNNLPDGLKGFPLTQKKANELYRGHNRFYGRN